jgi:hypothetical protein
VNTINPSRLDVAQVPRDDHPGIANQYLDYVPTTEKQEPFFTLTKVHDTPKFGNLTLQVPITILTPRFKKPQTSTPT